MADVPFPLQAEWLSAFENEDGYRLMGLLREDPRLLTVAFRGCNVLHLAMRHNWFGLVVETVRTLEDHFHSDRADILSGLFTAKEGATEQCAWFAHASGLDVLAMAVIQGHGAINKFLGNTISKFDCQFDESPHYKNVFRRSSHYVTGPIDSSFALSSNENEMGREILSRIMEECFCEKQGIKLEDGIPERWINRWKLTSPYLPLEEFLFLACHLDGGFYGNSEDHKAQKLVFERCAERMGETAFIKYLFTINDTRGTALHHAIESQRTYLVTKKTQGWPAGFGWSSEEFNCRSFRLSFNLIPPGEEFEDCVNMLDSLGRTPLLKAIALGREEECRLLLEDRRTAVNETYSLVEGSKGLLEKHAFLDFREWRINVGTVSEGNGYWPTEDVAFSALHLLICNPNLPDNKREKIMKLLLQRTDLDLNSLCFRETELSKARYEDLAWMTPLQLAAYVGDVTTLQLLATDDRAYDIARFSNESSNPYDKYDEGYSALHIAAMSGHARAIRFLLTTGKLDPVSLTFKEGDTALHFATRYEDPYDFPHTVGDFFEIPPIRSGTSYKPKESLSTVERQLMQRQGESNRVNCTNLLLQAGIEIWQTNHSKLTADVGPLASPEYSLKWYERLFQGTEEAKNNWNFASSSISVTAALVTAASYSGLLQPPGGCVGQGECLLQVDALSVQIFIVANTLAFYVALAAIMLSLSRSLPMRQSSSLDELKFVRISVTWAMYLLIFAIVAIFVAFASASIAIVPDGGFMTASTVVVGGVIISILLLASVPRFVRHTFHRIKRVRKWYKRCACM